MAKFSSVGVDVQHQPEQADYEPIPAGWYDAQIAKSAIEDTKARNGKVLRLELNILGPTAKGRVVFDRINLVNPSVQATKIGLSQLSGLERAVGLPKDCDSDDLVGKCLSVKVSVDPPHDGYEAGNSVKAYKPSDATAPAAAQDVPAAAGTPTATPGHKNPWD